MGNAAKHSTAHFRSPSSYLSPARSSLNRSSNSISGLVKPLIQPKLKIGAPNDKYEQEADRVAEQVMRMPEPGAVQTQSSPPHIQRLCPECEDEVQRQTQSTFPETNRVADTITPLVQRQEELDEEEDVNLPEAEEFSPMSESVDTRETNELEKEDTEGFIQPKRMAGMSPQLTPQTAQAITSLKGGGQPLPASERAFFEPRFGRNFNQVHVHSDNKAARTAQSINARAFTLGNDVVFGAGQYSPGTVSSRRLLAHELTHVVQQKGVSPEGGNAVASPLSTLQSPVVHLIQRDGGTDNPPKPKRRPSVTMIDYSKTRPRKRPFLADLMRKKVVTDSMIEQTQQFFEMWSYHRVPWHRAILACRLILADLKRGMNVTAAKTMKYARKAGKILRKGPARLKRTYATGRGWGFTTVSGHKHRLWNFDYNKPDLKVGHTAFLDRVIIPSLERIKANRVVITLSGRASQSGKNRAGGARNKALSGQRARNVMLYLYPRLSSYKYKFKLDSSSYSPYRPYVYEDYKDRAVVITPQYKGLTLREREQQAEKEKKQQAEKEKKFRDAKDEALRRKLYPMFVTERNNCKMLKLMKLSPSSIGVSSLKGGGLAKSWKDYFFKHSPEIPQKLGKKSTRFKGFDWSNKNAMMHCTYLQSLRLVKNSGLKIGQGKFDEFFNLYQKSLKK